MNTVLFLCSGNYYRSRFAEQYFNWLAENGKLPWRAESRGLTVGTMGNIGPISAFALEGLASRGIPPNGNSRFPRQVAEADLVRADVVIAVKEAEHRPALAQLFPHWVDRVHFWHVDDLDCAQPEETLGQLEDEVRALAARLRDGREKASG
jgi:protein-tyrosine phosphatase